MDECINLMDNFGMFMVSGNFFTTHHIFKYTKGVGNQKNQLQS